MYYAIRNTKYGVLPLIFLFIMSSPLYAQIEAFDPPEFDKVSGEEEIAKFERRFRNIDWTGRGLYKRTPIDNIKTNKLRAKLQAVFGHPTLTIEDLINQPDFTPGKAIQFEYRFVVNDSIPLMLLDVDGPFSRGLVYVGAVRYIDLMPQIKRALSRKLMNAEPAEYQDYFYSPERSQWFNVAYKNGEYIVEKIDSPPGMSYNYDYNY